MSKLFVANLSWETTEDQLKDHFSKQGNVVSVRIITDRNTGRSKGYGFVEMESDASANKAIDNLNDQPLQDRPLRVSLAQPKEERPSRGGSDRGEYSGRSRSSFQSDFRRGSAGSSSYNGRSR